MPTVPSYGSPKVGRAGIPGARLSVQADSRAFGSGVARGAQDVGDVALDVFEAERAKADQVRMLDIDRQLGEWENAKLHDPKTGAFAKRGKDAFGLEQEVVGDFDTFTGELTKDLSSDRQKLAARQLIDGRRIAVQRSLQGHVAGELKRVGDEAFSGGIAVSRSNALANYADQDRVEQESERQIQSIKAYADVNGLPSEWTEQHVGEAQSATYAGVIGRMLDRGEDLAAKDALKRWGGALTGEDAARIDGAMKVSSTRGASREIADGILGTGTDVDLQGALDALEKRQVADTDTYDQAKVRLVNHFRQQDEAVEAHQKGLLEQANAAIDAAADPSDPSSIPASLWNDMQSPYRKQAIAYGAAKARGVDVETPKVLWGDIERQKVDDPQGFAKRNLEVLPLSRADYERLTKEQGEIRKGNPKLIAGFQTTNQEIVQAMRQANMRVAKADEKQGDDELEFRRQLADAVTADQVRTGKELAPAQVGEIAKRLAQGVVLKRAKVRSVSGFANPFGDLFRSDGETYKHAFQSPIAKKLAAAYGQIPPAMAKKHRDALVAAGFVNPSEAQVLQRYNEDLVEAYRDGQ